MLELRVTADVKRIASMRDAIRRECARLQTGVAHAEMVAFVAEHLVGTRVGTRSARRSSEVLMIVTVQSDATMLMVREPRPAQSDLGEARQRVLQQHTTRWSTMSGRDGRTTWAEIARTAEPVPEPLETCAAECEAGDPVDAATWSDRAVRLRLRVAPAFPSSD